MTALGDDEPGYVTDLEIIDSRSEVVTCECCGGSRIRGNGYVKRDGYAYATYFASCYPSHREIWIDVILGTWGTGDWSDHVTFGCRYGHIDGYEQPSCSLVAAASVAPDDPLYGVKLDRDSALDHPWLPEFWEVVDLVLVADPVVSKHAWDIQSSAPT